MRDAVVFLFALAFAFVFAGSHLISAAWPDIQDKSGTRVDSCGASNGDRFAIERTLVCAFCAKKHKVFPTHLVGLTALALHPHRLFVSGTCLSWWPPHRLPR